MATKYVFVISTIAILMALTISSIDSQGLTLQKCIPKADMENITIKCSPGEIIAIQAAFFTSSGVDQCPFSLPARSNNDQPNNVTSNEIDDDDHRQFYNGKRSCTDDLRMTLNSRCSGREKCSVNVRKEHIHQCNGFDGWISLKYTCVSASKLHSYCDLDLNGNYGFVSNPGYPEYYPPYVCKWRIRGFPGQKVQIKVLDLSTKEPRYTKRKKMPAYECIDSLSIIEDNAKVATLCGEVKSNLIEYRSKTDHVVVQFLANHFSPTRGVLFKYTLVNCPTLKAPSNGHMFRNGSFAYYNCHFDFVFEDTGMPTRTLECEYDTYWNGSVTHCVPKENVTVMAYALTHAGENNDHVEVTALQTLDQPIIAKRFSKAGLFTPFVWLVAIVMFSVFIIILILVKFRKRTSNQTAV